MLGGNGGGGGGGGITLDSSTLVPNGRSSPNGGNEDPVASAGGVGRMRPAAVGWKRLVLVSAAAGASGAGGAKLAGVTPDSPDLLVASGSVAFDPAFSIPTGAGISVGAAPLGLGIVVPELFHPAAEVAAGRPFCENAACGLTVPGPSFASFTPSE
jgi:hypothetical protein